MDADRVGVVEVVSEIEFGEPEGDEEFCLGGGEVGGSEEGEGEFWAGVGWGVRVGWDAGWGWGWGAYR